MQGSLEATVIAISVLRPIGGEGWKVLAEEVRLHHGLLLWCVSVMKDDLDEATQEDIRVMWDALETYGWFHVMLIEGDGWSNNENVQKGEANGEARWTRLTEIKEMGKEKWAAELGFQLEEVGDGAAEEEEEGALEDV